MSLNQIVKDDFKFWLDPYVNSLKIDNNWEYKESDKAPNRSLILNSDVIAEWLPTPAASPFGNAFTCAINNQVVNTTFQDLAIGTLTPYSSYYSIQGSAISLVDPGFYIVWSCPTFTTNLSSQFDHKIQIETDVNDVFIDAPGSTISSPSGCTIFSGVFPVQQATPLLTSTVIQTITGNRRVKFQAKAGASGSLIGQQYSYVVIYKLI